MMSARYGQTSTPSNCQIAQIGVRAGARGAPSFCLKYSMIRESAPETAAGSFAPSLSLSKLWMCKLLKQLMRKNNINEFNQVYSLGSWYGNMALFMLLTHVPFKVLVDVDTDAQPLEISQAAFDRLAPRKRIISICEDANHLRYVCSPPSLVINNSTNNMRNEGWFDGIPRGTVVALQGRSDEPQNELNTCRSLGEFDRQYPLRQTAFVGTLSLEDPGDKYDRWMKIGLK